MTAPTRDAVAAGLERAARVRDAAAAIWWLERNPAEYDLILTLARLAGEPETVDLVGRRPVDQESVDAARRHAMRYLSAGFLGACIRCFEPVVTFADGRRIAWPGLNLHEHDALEPERPASAPVPLRQPAYRPAWRKPVAG